MNLDLPTTSTRNLIDIASVVDDQQFRWFNLKLVLLCWLVIFCDGYDIYAISYVGPAVAREWHITAAALGPIFSSSMFAYLVSVPLSAYCSDRFGRKPIMVICVVVICLSSFGSMFATGVTSLFVLRLLTGFGLGAVTPPTITHCAEFAPQRMRGRLVILMYSGINFGGVAAGIAAASLLTHFGWRAIFFVGGFMPCVAAILLVLFLPESIKFLALQEGDHDEVARMVRIMAPSVPVTGETRFTIAAEPKKIRFRLALLFSNGFGGVTSSVWAMFIFSYMGLFFVQSWLNFVLRAAGMTPAQAAVASSMLALGGILGGGVLSWFIDRFGMVAVAFFSLLFGVTTAGIGASVGSRVLLFVVIALAGFTGHAVLFGMNAVASSIYPTSFRTSAMGAALLVSRIGAVLGPIIGGHLIGMKLSIPKVFLFPLIPSSICMVVALLLARLFYKRFHGIGIPAPERENAQAVLTAAHASFGE